MLRVVSAVEPLSSSALSGLPELAEVSLPKSCCKMLNATFPYC
jgi:hypothetical protein